MTTYGAFFDGEEMSAQHLRLAIMAIMNTNAGALGVDGGVRWNSACPDALQVVPGVSGLTVLCKPGLCVIPGTDSVAQGPYVLASDADSPVTLTPAHGSQARYDRIVAQVIDNGDDTSTYAIDKVTGTAAPAPSLPAIPTSSLKLAAVLVPALANGPEDLTIIDERRQLGAIGRTFVNVPMVPAVGHSTPEYKTTSNTFVDMLVGTQQVQFGQIYIQVLCRADAGTTGEMKLTINDTLVGTVQSITDGEYTSKVIGTLPIPGFGSTIFLGSTIAIEVALRRVTGSGEVGVRVLNCQMRPLT